MKVKFLTLSLELFPKSEAMSGRAAAAPLVAAISNDSRCDGQLI